MKKKLMKDILEINKLLNKELKLKNKSNSELKIYNDKINKIEEKIEKINNKDKITNLSKLFKLYSLVQKKNYEKIFIENNLPEFKKQNQIKEGELDKNYKTLLNKSKSNEELISKKIVELDQLYQSIKPKISEEKEKIIISPDMMSINLESKTIKEIDFMNKIINTTKAIKLKNEKISKQIDSSIKTLTLLNSKKESSSNAELSTSLKNSSYSKKNLVNNLNFINLNNWGDNESNSSISMELETNINLDELPSDDESLRFIDKVFDTRSNIKPIKIGLKSIIDQQMKSNSKGKLIKVEPIKIERPIDYKSKEEDIMRQIYVVKNKIEIKKFKIKEIQNKRKKVEELYNKTQKDLNQALMKIKIIKEKINYLKKQIDDLSINYNKKEKYSRFLSINNIINNRNYCQFEKNENNSIYNKDTFKK